MDKHYIRAKVMQAKGKNQLGSARSAAARTGLQINKRQYIILLAELRQRRDRHGGRPEHRRWLDREGGGGTAKRASDVVQNAGVRFGSSLRRHGWTGVSCTHTFQTSGVDIARG